MRTRVMMVALACLVLVAGCKKDSSETTPTGPGTGTNPAIPTVSFKGPNTTSTDANAQLTKSSCQAMNGLMAWTAAYTSLTPTAASGNFWTWGYSVGGFSYALTGMRQSDGSCTWKTVYNGTNGSTSYTNWAAFEGSTAADGKTGSWTAYQTNSASADFVLSYTTSAQNVLTGTWIDYASNGTTVNSKQVITNNPDGSGSLETYGSGGAKLTYKSVWASNGTGTWFTYDSNGNQIATGTW